MNHSDYVKLIRCLGNISKNADQIRMGFSMYYAVTEDGAVVATSTPEQYKDSFKLDRAKIWREAVKTDKELCQYLDGLTDGWFERNQERADKGLGPTADERELYGAMVSFLSATAIPVEMWGFLYENTRNCCNTWTAHTLSWFPDLADLSARACDECEIIQEPSGKVTPSIREEITREDAGATSAIKHGEKFTAQPSRQELAMCFNDEFRRPRPGETESRLDKLIHAMQATSFTRKDWGRVAYAIQANRRIRNDRIYRIGFSKWMVEFFSIIGVPCPSYLRIAEYKDQAGTRSFITNYLSV